MKPGTAVLLVAALLSVALAVPVTAINTVEVTVIGSNGQPVKDLTIYLVKNNEDTTRALAQNRTDSNGRAVIRVNITSDGTYWIVSKGPVIYDSFALSAGGGSFSRTYRLNDTASYRNVTFIGVLDQLPDSAVKGNLTLRTAAGSVKAVDVPLVLNIAYFPATGTGVGATLSISRTVSKFGVTYTLVNMTVYFRNGTTVGLNVTSYDIDPVTVKGITVFYRSTGAFLGLPLTFWVAIGILLVAAGGFIAISRSRRAAAAVLRERRVLRGTDLYVLDNGIDWQSLVNGNLSLEERMRRSRRALRRGT